MSRCPAPRPGSARSRSSSGPPHQDTAHSDGQRSRSSSAAPADRQTGRQTDRQTGRRTLLVRQTGGRGPASGWPCMMQDSDAPHPPAGRGLCSRGSAAAPLQTSAGRRTPTSSSTAAHKQEVSSGHTVRTAHHLVCLRSVGKLTSTTVLLGHTCPCGCRQSKQLPWRGYSQSDHCLTVVSMTVLL